MKESVERTRNDGCVLGEDISKVDNSITHQVNPELMETMSNRFAEVFAGADIARVITIKTSGIVPALYVAQKLGVSAIFTRKVRSLTMDEKFLTASVYLFTKQVTSQIFISRKFLSDADRVLIIDGSLVNGRAAKRLVELCQQANAKVEGIGIIIKKPLRDGRQLLGDMGLNMVSLAHIASLSEGMVAFLEEDA